MSDANATDTRQELERDLEQAKRDAAGLADTARERGREQLQSAKGAVAEGAERIAAAVEATADELEHLYQHFERVMLATGFLDPASPRHLMRRLRRLFNRAQVDENELNILRGLLSSVEAPTGKKHRGPV